MPVTPSQDRQEPGASVGAGTNAVEQRSGRGSKGRCLLGYSTATDRGIFRVDPAGTLATGNCNTVKSTFQVNRRHPQKFVACWFSLDSVPGLDVCDKMENRICEEIQIWNYYVIFRTKRSIVSALGAIPKPNTDNIRLVHDCSLPEHNNINPYASTQHFSYVTLDEAVSLIKPDAYLVKIDLKSAYGAYRTYKGTGLDLQFSGENHTTVMYDFK
ncbi:hypothetical protein ACROYT_G021171 [Oculina patagonica]